MSLENSLSPKGMSPPFLSGRYRVVLCPALVSRELKERIPLHSNSVFWQLRGKCNSKAQCNQSIRFENHTPFLFRRPLLLQLQLAICSPLALWGCWMALPAVALLAFIQSSATYRVFEDVTGSGSAAQGIPLCCACKQVVRGREPAPPPYLELFDKQQ